MIIIIGGTSFKENGRKVVNQLWFRRHRIIEKSFEGGRWRSVIGDIVMCTYFVALILLHLELSSVRYTCVWDVI